MKSLILCGCVSILGLSSVAAIADDEPTTCSLATLHGTYAYAGVYFRFGAPVGASGMEFYDGHGKIKTYDQGSDGMTSFTSQSTGTYTITPNCIATVIYDGDTANPHTYFVAPDGNVFYYNNNNNHGRVSGGHEDRISRSSLVP